MGASVSSHMVLVTSCLLRRTSSRRSFAFSCLYSWYSSFIGVRSSFWQILSVCIGAANKQKERKEKSHFINQQTFTEQTELSLRWFCTFWCLQMLLRILNFCCTAATITFMCIFMNINLPLHWWRSSRLVCFSPSSLTVKLVLKLSQNFAPRLLLCPRLPQTLQQLRPGPVGGQRG